MQLIIGIMFLFLQTLFVFEGSRLYENWSYFWYGCLLVALWHDNLYRWLIVQYQKYR